MLLAVAASGLVGVGQQVRRGRRSRRRPVTSGAVSVTLLLVAGVVGGVLLAGGSSPPADPAQAIARAPTGSALAAVREVAVRGRAPKTGYARTRFGEAWTDVDHNGCDTRDDVLRRDLTDIQVRSSTRGCVVVAGILADPYTGQRILFSKSAAAKVQIDHVVALSDAWQTGAQSWSDATRLAFANDPLELLAVDGTANQDKGDGDAATWLPPQKSFRCPYVSRQVAVKLRYHLWVTPGERDAIARVLQKCPDEQLP
ncbi:MAG TPA: DUF1524 domain-containing protein [Frankiaceae bacterium]|nr:DUF1524 domain-containing protein [Frankiaceae bacterium]